MHSPRSTPKSISIDRRLVKVIGGSLAALLVVSAFLGVRAFTDTLERARLAELESENRALKAEIANLDRKVQDFETQMAEHVEFEERLRILADLEPMDEDVWAVGVGGPDLPGVDAAPAPSGELTSLNQDVDRLLRQIRLQRNSYEKIVTRLEEKAEELCHIPSIRPVDVGYISSYFGRRHDPFTGRYTRHYGVDFSARKGSNIYVTADGVVAKSKYERGYGHTIEVDHGNGIVTKYAHNQKNLVRRGEKVTRGEIIAKLGSSGRSTAPHLHYEVQVNGVPKNPLNYILPSGVVVD
jgi:murein DD-endopeptidase MepM/ murein hydrolase activator NlpD